MIRFLIRLLKNIASFLCLELPLQLLGILILLPYLPIARYFMQKNGYQDLKLNKFLRWFDSVDQYVGRDQSSYLKICKSPFLTHYDWLTLRNPINYFQYLYLGFQFTGEEKYSILGSLDVGDSKNREEGLKIIELSGGYYEYLLVKKIDPSSNLGGLIRFLSRNQDPMCFYFRMGWKIGNMQNPKGSYCQKVFNVSLRTYSGV